MSFLRSFSFLHSPRPCFSRCAIHTCSWVTCTTYLTCIFLSLTPNPLPQRYFGWEAWNLHLTKLPRWFFCLLRCDEHWYKRMSTVGGIRRPECAFPTLPFTSRASSSVHQNPHMKGLIVLWGLNKIHVKMLCTVGLTYTLDESKGDPLPGLLILNLLFCKVSNIY